MTENERIYADARKALKQFEQQLTDGFRFQLSITKPKVSRNQPKPTEEQQNDR